MEKRNLPNATAVLVLGILSILTCCCYGIIGLILGIIALVLANKDMKLYRENPELYSNYQNLNIGKILAIIGVVLSAIYFMVNIYLYVVVGEEGMKDMMENLKEKIEYEQEQ
ncbi:CCC motif membrane protein [Flavobacterium sp.]|uniref:CCC motif membrane protein n=1 Tax=Flavobacterium sp. TaxID=239 RepID=UPI002B4B7F52|nr:CCC motif membrane protein [Flavobacterium sp.]HLF53041.1 CCC motif membrane protein [Flavobacterium sp.]